jgi:hypothetical protein
MRNAAIGLKLSVRCLHTLMACVPSWCLVGCGRSAADDIRAWTEDEFEKQPSLYIPTSIVKTAA